MSKKIPLGIAIGLMALAAAATFMITYNYAMNVFNNTVRNVSEREEIYTRLSEMDKYVRANYIYDLDETALTDSMMKGYIAGIGDKYAVYYSADEYAESLNKDAGVKIGLGFEWEKETSGYIKVTKVLEGSAAANAGILAGDIITAVNNTDVIAYENGYDEASALLKCAEGTKVKLHIKRKTDDGNSAFFSTDVVSEKTEIISVTGRLIEEMQTGYVKITTFNEKTPEQFRAVVNNLISDGAECLVFDLRGNLGGLITSLQGTLDCVLGSGDVVKAKFVDHEDVIVRTTEAEKISMPMAVIVNAGTASCSELFALALRDNGGAQIVGTQTYGKGVMQYIHKLSGGTAVKITVATFETEKSGDYNKIGIKPNFEVALPSEVDLNALTPDEQFIYDTQFVKALEVVQTLRRK